MKFKSNIEVQSGIEDSAASAGAAGQLLSSLGPVAGVDGVEWIDPSTIVAEAATVVVIACKNTSNATISKGTPVYQTGNVGATAVIQIAEADALISANKGPAIGLLQDDLIPNDTGFVVIIGKLLNFITDPIDGATPITGDKIFVKSGGGLTTVKPTTSLNSIQAIGLVGKVSGGTSGSVTVSSTMRANDVPNLPEGRIWVGDGNTLVSDTVYIDEPNLRLGIGTTSPSAKLEVDGTINFNSSGDHGFLLNPGAGTFSLGDKDGVYYENWIESLNGNIDIYNGGSLTFRADINNRVGIGAPTPDSKLEVASSLGSSTDLHVRNNGTGFTRLKMSNATGSTSGFQIINNQGLTGGNKVDLRNYNASALTLWTSNVQRMTILSGGNVGIGTTSPVTKLNISSTTYNDHITLTRSGAELGISVSAGQLMFEGGVSPFGNNGTDLGRSDKHWREAYVYSVRSGGVLQFKTSGNSEKMRIDTSGNVGIGTTTPGAKLDVAGDIKAAAIQLTTGAADTYVLTSDASGNASWSAGASAASGTGAVLSLTRTSGYYYNMSVANSATTYTTSGTTLGAFACTLINAASEPTVTGATKIKGSDFTANTPMHLWVQYFGVTVQYFFTEL